jgi:glucosamine-6-phosphate deaminase
MNLLTTFSGSMMEGFLPRGWDLARIDACCAQPPESIGRRQPWWHADFEPVACGSVADFDVMLGHEIAQAIRRARQQGRESALILIFLTLAGDRYRRPNMVLPLSIIW